MKHFRLYGKVEVISVIIKFSTVAYVAIENDWKNVFLRKHV